MNIATKFAQPMMGIAAAVGLYGGAIGGAFAIIKYYEKQENEKWTRYYRGIVAASDQELIDSLRVDHPEMAKDLQTKHNSWQSTWE